MPITTRQATPQDIPLLVEMMQEFYAESNYPLDQDWATASFTALLSHEPYGAIWLVSYNNEPAGYAVLTVRLSMEYGGLDAFIDDLFVHSAYRRRRLGQALLGALFSECKRRNILALHVEVGHDNTAAKALYQRNGLCLRDGDREVLTARLDASVDGD